MNRQVARSTRKLLEKIWCFALVIGAASSVSIAQENPPWPPDRETLFAPGFEVVSVEYFELPEPTPTAALTPYCDQRPSSDHRYNKWVSVLRDDQWFICNIDSGEQRGPFQLTFDDVQLAPAAVTPDGEWLILGTSSGEVTLPITTTYYSYHPATGQRHALGQVTIRSGINSIGNNGFTRWLSTTRGAFEISYGGESVADEYYAFDVTQPDSFQLITSGWMYDYYDDPPRYEYTETYAFTLWETGSFATTSRCNFTLYDATGVYRREVGYDCIGARVFRAGEDYLTVRVDSPESAKSRLLRFNPHSGYEVTHLLDEIEWFVGVSPDGRYAALVIGTNGRVNLENYYPPYGTYPKYHSYYPLHETVSLVVLDVQAGKSVYEAPLELETEYAYSNLYHFWCGDDCFAYSTNCEHQTLLRFTDEKVITSPPLAVQCGDDASGNFAKFSPDQQYILDDYCDAELEYCLVDVETGERQRLFASKLRYHTSANWLDDETLQVRLMPFSRSNSQDRRMAVYTVSITFEHTTNDQ